jgi:hypothetical protein
MRLGVPFIAPRQLGAVESNLGRLILPSVDWRTGQSGAHRTLSGVRFPSKNSAVDRWRPESRWRTGQSGAHRTVSGARFPSINGAVDRWQPESRWRTGQSGEF